MSSKKPKLQGRNYTGTQYATSNDGSCSIWDPPPPFSFFLLFMYGCVNLLKAKVMAGKERRADLVV